jgi:hypothetical protein
MLTRQSSVIVWIVVTIFLVFCGGCASSGRYWSSWIPGYTWRVYDPYSTTALRSDGSIYVLHGELLQHYNSNREKVSEVSLPLSFALEDYPNPFELKMDDSESIYVGTRDGIFLMDTEGNVIWRQDNHYYLERSLTVFEDGAFFVSNKKSQWTAQFVSNAGALLWEKAGSAAGDYLAFAVIDRNHFVLACTNQLFAVDGAGLETYRLTVPEMDDYDYPYLAANGNRVALACRAGVYLFENGELLWYVPSHTEYGRYEQISMPSNDRVAVYYKDSSTENNNAVYLYNAVTGVRLSRDTLDYCGYFTTANQGYLTNDNIEINQYLTLRSLSDGSKIWSIPLAQYYYEEVKHEDQIVEHYSSCYQPVLNQSGGFFIVENGTLVEFDEGGQRIWEQPATQYTDKYIPGHYRDFLF